MYVYGRGRGRSGIREIGQESVRTVWPCFRLCAIARTVARKKRMDADRIKGNKERLDEQRREEQRREVERGLRPANKNFSALHET